LIGKGAGLPADEQQALVTGTLLACGIGALLQASRWRLGSSLLVIPISGSVFVPVAIQAGTNGGLWAIALLSLMVGLVQVPIGRFIGKVRAFFPPEVCGVVVLMLGVSLIPGALRRMLGVGSMGGEAVAAARFMPEAALIGGITLATIVVAAVWLKGSARFFAMVIGCAAGLVAAALTGFTASLGDAIAAAPLLALPPLLWPSFASLPTLLSSVLLALLPVIVLLALVDSVDGMGVLISTHRLDDADWQRPNMTQVSRGVQSIGLTNILSGLLGGTATCLSSSNIGLAFSTGVTARIVAIVAGAILIASAFFPKLIALVLAIPDPVLGGILAYVASYFVVMGADLALSRMLSQRRLLVIGLSITAGLAVLALPEVFHGLSGPLAFIFESPLAVSALFAIVLNSLMRVGIAQTFTTTLAPGVSYGETARELLDELGEQWGLHRETAVRAGTALHELLDVLCTQTSGPIKLVARTDDLHLDLRLLYDGPAMIFPDRRPTPEEMLDDPDAVARMSGWLLRHMAGRAVSFAQEDQQGVWLRFDS
jgi:xanthine/uracil permease